MTEGYRRAAAALYSLNGQDRDTILAELPEAEQTRLRSLIRELDELGFEPGVLQAAAATTPAAAPAEAPAACRITAAQRAAAVSAEEAARVLAAESVALVGQLLRIEEWPWTAGFLALLAGPRRAAVRQAMESDAAPAPARDRALLERFVEQLGQQAEFPVVVPGKAKRAPRLTRKVLAWIR